MPTPLTVLKIGGGLLPGPGRLAAVGRRLVEWRPANSVVVVPGGGPFADLVRSLDREHGLSPTSAHWMAVLGMDQYAWMLHGATPGSRLVEDRGGLLAAHQDGQLPILAPSRWLRAADELPHRWEVTSDSLAAYLATLLGAMELVLVKPVSGGTELLDPWFARVAPADLRVRIVGVEEFLAASEARPG